MMATDPFSTGRNSPTKIELDALFAGKTIPVIKNGDVNRSSKTASTMRKTNVQDFKVFDPFEFPRDLAQLDWERVKNIPLLSMFKSVDPTAILINPAAPNRLMEESYEMFEEGEETRGILFKVAAKAGKDHLSRLIVTDVFLEEEIDQSILQETIAIPLEPGIRAIILGLEQIDPRYIERYMKVMPDKGRVLDPKVAKAVATSLLLSERSEYEDDRNTASRVEKWIFENKSTAFPGNTLEYFASSIDSETRKKVACLPDLSERVGLFLGLQDPSNENLKELVKCTNSCNVLDAIEVNENASASTLSSARSKKRSLGCD